MKLIFATNNQHKVDEIQHIIGNTFDVVSLKAAGIDIDIPEPHDTLEENAVEKSSTIYKLTNTDCFSEDTGLEVEALNGEPGVKSARYAGDVKDFNKNIEKLLLKLGNGENRKARFRTVISLIINKEQYLFEGICEGEIIYSPKGTNGFGYDAIFVSSGADKTFAEMTMEEKNVFSHRKKATEKLVLFLNKLNIR
ncbi:RdgB/HAM1 family non-canonical purine NTP pyrophosphatase [Pinibacter soli]|uniref:dITP/XTP pyrophosphatase n=1 Tax=Pinibacter soli TaxID=3044211 RepID=A0ABT6RBD0_9BACT|nr:RdgB/HAM1 family non-canonical purine NTP pyrophosphatase [Pinibacter soli]MDI3319887.1 RdgB/HAM1 family non-canonical purine NTP pyrophosphatase [Pinibacter soli]